MTVANPPVRSTSPYKGLLARHSLVFFLIAYVGSWLAGAYSCDARPPRLPALPTRRRARYDYSHNVRMSFREAPRADISFRESRTPEA